MTTDHISPAGSIKKTSPAGTYLIEHGVNFVDFNSYGSRRGNDRVMTRGTFANVRIKNLMVPGVEGGVTKFQPGGETMSIFDAAMKYAGQTRRSSSWPARNTARAVRAIGRPKGRACLGSKSWSRKVLSASTAPTWWAWACCRCNSRKALRRKPSSWTAPKPTTSLGLSDQLKPQQDLTLRITRADGKVENIPVACRIDTPIEIDYYQHGGILPFVLRQLAGAQ